MAMPNESPPARRADGLRRLSSDQQDPQTIAGNRSGVQEPSACFPAPDEPPPMARGNGAGACLSPTEFSRHTGHDRHAEDARAVRVEDELARRRITLRGRGSRALRAVSAMRRRGSLFNQYQEAGLVLPRMLARRRRHRACSAHRRLRFYGSRRDTGRPSAGGGHGAAFI